jgi:hypothetical protein
MLCVYNLHTKKHQLKILLKKKNVKTFINYNTLKLNVFAFNSNNELWEEKKSF